MYKNDFSLNILGSDLLYEYFLSNVIQNEFKLNIKKSADH